MGTCRAYRSTSSSANASVLFLLPVVALVATVIGAVSCTADIGSFVVLADIHLDPLYTVGSEADCPLPLCCRPDDDLADLLPEGWLQALAGRPVSAAADAASDPASPYGEGLCDVPVPTVGRSVLEFAALLHPDFVLFAGDVLPHDIWKQSRDDVLDVLHQQSVLFQKYFSAASIPVFPVLGDHDTFPYSTFDVPSSWGWLYEPLANDIWQPFFSSAEEQQAFLRNGGFYSRLVEPSGAIRLVGLNSQYWALRNVFAWEDLDGDPAGQLSWLRAELSAARAEGQRVYLLMHLNLGMEDGTLVPTMVPSLQESLLSIFAEFEDVIELNVGGHLHWDSFHLLRSGAGSCFGVQLLTPSVTPYQNLNPAVREIVYDRSSGQVVDIITHYLDIQAFENDSDGVPTDNAKLAWQRLYSFRSEYPSLIRPGEALSCDAFDAILQNLASDDDLWLRWTELAWRLYNSSDHASCASSDSCRKNVICAMSYPKIPEFLLCLQR